VAGGLVFVVVLLLGSAPATADPAGPEALSCHGSRPVVLIHDLARTEDEWQPLAERLNRQGICVRTLTYGRNATGLGGLRAIEDSAGELAHYLDRVRAANPGTQVDLVAHGAGSLVAWHYLHHFAKPGAVRSLTSLGPLWNGTNALGLGSAEQLSRDLGTYPLILAIEAPLEEPFCAACREMITGSDFLRAERALGTTVPGVRETSIVTSADEVVVPAGSGLDAGMTDVVVQDIDPHDTVDHFGLPADPVVTGLVIRAVSANP
jgi:triacylglycerol esterase/lipase EstA (alpha/beta hydrolase family)